MAKKKKYVSPKFTGLRFSPTSYAFFGLGALLIILSSMFFLGGIDVGEKSNTQALFSLLPSGLFSLIVGYLYRLTSKAQIETNDLVKSAKWNPDDRGENIGCPQFLGLPISFVLVAFIGVTIDNPEESGPLVFFGSAWLLIVALPMVTFIRQQKEFNETFAERHSKKIANDEKQSRKKSARAAKTIAENQQKVEEAEAEYHLKKDQALFLLNEYLQLTQTNEEKLKEQIKTLRKNINAEKATLGSLKKSYPFIQKIITNR